MNKLYEKSQVLFAVLCIAVYVVGSSVTENLSAALGVEKLLTLPFHLVLSLLLWRWVRAKGLGAYYGLRSGRFPASRLLYYLPLVLIASSGLWGGIGLTLSPLESAIAFLTMLLVGFLEELLFRGFLFRAMEKDNLRAAVIVSSLTFGLGHIVNLLNGRAPGETLMQIAFAVGFMLVLLFWKNGSLWPCVLFHSANNALNVFSSESSSGKLLGHLPLEAVGNGLILLLAVGYALYLHKALPSPEEDPAPPKS